MIIALAKLSANDAFDEWISNSFAFRSNSFPDFWPNIWSSSDVSTSGLVNIKQNGKAIGTSNWSQFPISCTHSYSWPLYSFANGIIGVTSTKMNNLIIQPALPKEIGGFSFHSDLIKVIRDDANNYDIKYKPKQFIGNAFELILDLSVVEKDIQHANKYKFVARVDNNHLGDSVHAYYSDATKKFNIVSNS